MKILLVITVTATLCMTNLSAQENAKELLARAMEAPNDETALERALPALKDTRDPEALANLKRLFEITESKKDRQLLAIFLTAQGHKDDAYFNELAKYAEMAVSTDAPMPYFLDSEGNAIQGQVPLAFENWCAEKKLPYQDCYMLVANHAVDMYYLTMIRDRRAAPIFRRGLTSTNHGVITASIHGLGMIADNAALPLVEAAMDKLRPKQREVAASMLTEFDDVRVGPMLDRFIKDPKWRRQLDEQIVRRRTNAAPSMGRE